MNFPEELRYTTDHEWAKEENGVVVIGITDFAINQLGDITLVEMPEVGEKVEAGATIGTIESVKAVSDLCSPLTGEVTAINEALEDTPETVNEAPYGDGWMLKIKLDDAAQLNELMDAAAYKAHIDTLDD